MSKIKFLKTTTNYLNYINAFKVKNSNISELTYEQTLDLYLSDCNAWAYYWKTNLELTGNFECVEIIQNADFLQKKWAKEHNFHYNEENWQQEILIEQIKFFNPDVLFIVDQYNNNSLSLNIKKIVPNIKLILGWDGILWHKPETFANTDIILTCVPETAAFYKSIGKNSYYYKFGFEATILDKLTKFQKGYDATFTGSLVLTENYHYGRLQLVADISRKVDLSIFASSLPEKWSLFGKGRFINTLLTKRYKFGFDLHRVGFKNKGEVFGLDMFNVLYNSKIVLNTHGDNSLKTAANMRMTEATGVGSLLLTDWKENLNELFVIDEEVVTYKSAGEAADKIKMLLNNESLRKKIAENGQKRTLRDYSYKNSMMEFSKFLNNYL